MKLRILKNGRYELTYGPLKLEGNGTYIVTKLREDLLIDLLEIDAAMGSLRTNGHDIAEFDRNGVFSVSYSSRTRNQVILELAAIKSVKDELYKAYREGDGRTPWEVFERLNTLLLALNVDKVLSVVVGTDEETAETVKKVA